MLVRNERYIIHNDFGRGTSPVVAAQIGSDRPPRSTTNRTTAAQSNFSAAVDNLQTPACRR